MRKTLIYAAAGLAVCALLAGCGPPAEKPYAVVGIDCSGSTAEFDNQYAAERTAAIEWVAREQGEVTVDLIDGNALAGFENRFTKQFKPDPGLGGNQLLVADALTQQGEQAAAEAGQALKGGCQTDGSDPLGFALAAAQTLPRDGRPKFLVFLSDMYQRAQGLDLYHAPLTDQWIKEEIDQLEAADKVAQFPDGAKVIVVGGGRSGGGVPAQVAIHVERFWKAYFQAGGADVVAWGPRFTAP
jgi:hypothetical protein